MKGKYVHDAMIVLFNNVLDQMRNNQDTVTAHEIVKIIKSFYYCPDDSPLKPLNSLPFMHSYIQHLQKELKPHPIWGDMDFWENYTLTALRDALRGSKLTSKDK